MRSALLMRRTSVAFVCLAVIFAMGCEASDDTAGKTLQDLGITRNEAKRELQIRAMLHRAESNRRLAEYIGDQDESLMTLLSDWDSCKIVEVLNEDFLANTSLGTEVEDSSAPSELASRVCAIVDADFTTHNETAGTWEVDVSDLPTSAEWPVDQQRLTGICATGFLYLEADIVATAGHAASICHDNHLCVFDFTAPAGGGEAGTTYSEDQVRRIESVIEPSSNSADWALLQLEEEMDRDPLLPGDANIQEGDDVFSLGHPYGLPLKFAGVDEIICPADEQEDCPQFKTDLIMHTRNSGSPVFLADGTLVGLHTQHYGDTVLVYETETSCLLLDDLAPCVDEYEEGDPADECCDAAFCGGSDEIRIDLVVLDEEDTEAVQPAEIINTATGDAFMYMGKNLERVIQLAPKERIRVPTHMRVVQLFSCGDWKDGARCRFLTYGIRPGERFKIRDEKSDDIFIEPGTRVVMERY